MLLRLEINNFALITNSVFEPHNGLSVITGETGAGKSLLVDAIGIILGNKASKTLIRSNCDSANVEAVFDISDVLGTGLTDILSETGIPYDDNQLIIERRISADGKSLARINGRSVILTTLRQICSFLVDIHGQHDTQSIFDEKSHIVFLDSFGGEEIEVRLNEYKELLSKYKKIVLEIRNLSLAPDALIKRKDYLEHAIKEIEEANFTVGDEEKLTSRYKQLKSSLKLGEILTYINDLISGEDDNGQTVVSRLGLASKEALKLSNIDPVYESIVNALSSAFYEAEAYSSEISSLLGALDFDEGEIVEVERRIGLLMDLKSKYGDSVEAILAFAQDALEELKGMEDVNARIAALKKERAVVEKETLKSAGELSDIRRKYSKILSDSIVRVLDELEIPNARFEVEFCERPKERFFSSRGTEDIRFLFSANPGEALKPLSSTASGGEASRIMLAIKTIFSEVDDIPTLIFDEIDTGVSGISANKIAIKLRTISRKHQVLCVTHTAQLAAAADNNYKISKGIHNNTTTSVINELGFDDKVAEVSRLLSGDMTNESVDLAKKLIGSFS